MHDIDTEDDVFITEFHNWLKSYYGIDTRHISDMHDDDLAALIDEFIDDNPNHG